MARYNERYTGTQNLYRAIFKKLPKCDLKKADSSELLEILSTLDGHEGEVIRGRFGIEQDRATQVALGNELGVSGKRISVIEMRALLKLRHPLRSEQIRILYASRADLLEDVRRLRRQQMVLLEKCEQLEEELYLMRVTCDELRQKLGVRAFLVNDSDDNVAVLALRIKEDMGFSLRTKNCLEYERIEMVGELIQYTAKKLLDVPCLGKKTLKEIERKLAMLGLSLAIED